MVSCPNIQVELNQFYQTCDASMLREPMPFFDFLWSDINTSGIQQIVTPSGGKIKTINLRYDKRLLESEVDEVSNCATTCVSTTKRNDYSTTIEIDPCDKLQISESMTAIEWAYACQSNEQIVAKKIQMMVDAVVRKMATRLTTQAATLLGNWDSSVTNVDGDGNLCVTLMNGTALNPFAMADIDLAMMQTNFCSTTAIFAGVDVYKYYRALNAGCCSSQGIDLASISAQYGKAVLYDKRVQTASGSATYAWVLQAGSLLPIYYTENNSSIMNGAGIAIGDSNVQLGANYYKTVIQDPQSGLPMDLTIADNCGVISIIIEANAKLYSLPQLFQAGDTMEGVSFFAGINSDC
tara:strand:+ start:7294 stop:8346 length:1053 start_codon:yes stop_codon:yes gene_type:complete